MHKVGLIGYGSFGKALHGWLADSCEFVIYDPATSSTSAKSALAQPIIVLAIPAQHLESFLIKHADSLSPRALYLDVCSVKVKPVAIMQKLLPESAQIIATHPLFGPRSSDKIAGQCIMMHPVRAQKETYSKTKNFMSTLGLRIIETTPEQHDQEMAYVQGLSHYLSRIMQEMAIPESKMSTKAYRNLLEVKDWLAGNSAELFYSIEHENPYAQTVLTEFDKARAHINEQFQL